MGRRKTMAGPEDFVGILCDTLGGLFVGWLIGLVVG